ncbi:spore photoproduct lyase family protein [Methylobacterium oryzihabitans]|uniref:Radical SAM protein n=1 Tax=Methylobacterium oryzihabitans TaxID=2499852 RepID=A0A437P5V1_9HYPH|nr:radical SAM protein [Methylobacterium oryzihabitans]RVU17518.1 radical SAM protein [Methylobacterium oryzihabitans]
MTALLAEPAADAPPKPKLWRPRRVLVTPAALEWEHGRAMAARAEALGIETVRLKANRLAGLSGPDPRRAYVEAKSTLAVVVAPPAKRRLQPIPPSADWRLDLAEGCPAHCQYCYLAGSLAGPPVTRAYANLPEILDGLGTYLGTGAVTSRSDARRHEGTTFEASCYTDPLAIEHLTGSLAAAIRHVGRLEAEAQLRFTTKFDAVGPLLDLPHRRRTRIRISVNAAPLVRFEGGTAALPARFAAARRMARAGYRVGLTVAPIMPVEGWEAAYAALLDGAAAALGDLPEADLTVELITHRFTPGSKEVLTGWYPGSDLEMDEAARARKRTKFGSLKYVYAPETMRAMRAFFECEIARRLPAARILYWT